MLLFPIRLSFSMDEKEAEARPVMGTIFLVKWIVLMHYEYHEQMFHATKTVLRLKYVQSFYKTVGRSFLHQWIAAVFTRTLVKLHKSLYALSPEAKHLEGLGRVMHDSRFFFKFGRQDFHSTWLFLSSRSVYPNVCSNSFFKLCREHAAWGQGLQDNRVIYHTNLSDLNYHSGLVEGCITTKFSVLYYY